MSTDEQIEQDANTPDCAECGHRSLQHRLGNEPCNQPRCECSTGR